MKDQELVALIQGNPDEGIRIAMDLYGKAVHTICNNYLKDIDSQAVEEAVSESFIRLWRYIGSYKTEQASLKSYLYQIARNASCDIRKRYHIEASPLEEEEDLCAELDVEHDYEKKFNQRLVQKTIEEMKEPVKSIFILRFFYFCRVKEIASRLQLPEKTVENHLQRGKKRLREALLEGGILYE